MYLGNNEGMIIILTHYDRYCGIEWNTIDSCFIAAVICFLWLIDLNACNLIFFFGSEILITAKCAIVIFEIMQLMCIFYILHNWAEYKWLCNVYQKSFLFYPATLLVEEFSVMVPRLWVWSDPARTELCMSLLSLMLTTSWLYLNFEFSSD